MTSEKRHRIHPKIRQRSRELRQSLTPAEGKLWSILRNRNLGNYKFRRQHPIGLFITDFYCAKVKLIVEVDGAVHAGQEEYDQARTDWLEERGYHRRTRLSYHSFSEQRCPGESRPCRAGNIVRL